MTHSGAVDSTSPFRARLSAYLKERFPLVQYGILIASYCSSNHFLAQALTRPGRPVFYDAPSIAGAAALFCMFFHLRVFDEHKDYEEDLRNYPDRILSRGLISLTHLKILGAGAIGLEILLGALVSPAALTAVLAALLFSLLMLKEFFASEWLREHFLLYTASHMLIMPLFALMIYSFTTGRFPWEAPPLFLLYAAVGLIVTLNWEVSRKIRAPEDEIRDLGSYSGIFGTYGAAYLVILIRVVDTGLVYIVGYALGGGHRLLPGPGRAFPAFPRRPDPIPDRHQRQDGQTDGDLRRALHRGVRSGFGVRAGAAERIRAVALTPKGKEIDDEIFVHSRSHRFRKVRRRNSWRKRGQSGPPGPGRFSGSAMVCGHRRGSPSSCLRGRSRGPHPQADIEFAGSAA